MSFLQIPYREARDGFWGEQTSTLNWCEEDYNITKYCAEFVNTVTNVMFLWLGSKGIRDCLTYPYSTVFIVGFIGYMVVGMGSIAFHTTLKYSMQLADELPMIYSTCIMGFTTFSHGKSRKVATFIGLGFFSFAVAVTAIYWITKDPSFHQAAYALVTVTLVFRKIYDQETVLKPALRARNPARADQLMKELRLISLSGAVIFLTGYGIWWLDNLYCHNLRAWRSVILLPWAVILEGHAWWHLFTGLGAYYFIVWHIWARFLEESRENDYQLQWPSIFTSVPRVVPVRHDASDKARKTKLANSGVPDRQLVMEIETQAIQAQQQISLVRTQMASKQREMRLAQLTRSEMAALPPQTAVYEGVGKMFVAVPGRELDGKLEKQVRAAETEIEGLGKKLHYLETTAKNSQAHIEQMLKGAAA
ncbi:uncharacterized protein E0L32_003061 [Thyridium curvatum]|uniref:Ceramidase n=1 Tax=Thyridium curvatum TaxID=1093900 RepID=A0A507BL72_9PEZI|nr:uncharacterized protein E0L32_003061 [Thyridium curvatum]TPX17418.1 hypothetical protein E0L32_003061 [Thyridium curvatum]